MRIPQDGGKRVALSPHPNNAISTNSTDHNVVARLDEDEKGVSQIDPLGGYTVQIVRFYFELP